jgi:hypothetical protein
MGNCAEDCVKKHNFSREDQDAYAIQSYKVFFYLLIRFLLTMSIFGVNDCFMLIS